MTTPLLPAQLRYDVPAWTQTVQAFLAEKERRSGSRRTVEGYSRMLWPFLTRIGSPELVTPAHVLAWAYGIGVSGREPSSATVGARNTHGTASDSPALKGLESRCLLGQLQAQPSRSAIPINRVGG
jgi:hypothetical protein